ncbi:MAG TPA: lipid-A-disaccharide synthase [Candidatus Saccharimonadales bacterium]|jgi:lipid-A-disaccharide synthase|nr:lipid-A-disaccharide synthase [Candidatus Saccharimonadales bacterium]
MNLLLSAGEASGDNYGAQLQVALRQLQPESAFFGMGGEKMRAAGCELLVNASDVAVVGLAEVVTHLPAIYGKFKGLVAEARKRHPDAAVLIDFPDFNLRLARELHKLGIPVFYFVSPQIWAWRSGRVRQIRKFIRRMIVIFPFEQEFYRKHEVEVTYVGHPLAYLPEPQISRAEYAVRHKLGPAREWIALLPGSRRKEVRLNLPAMLAATGKLGGNYEYILPVASTLQKDFLGSQLAHAPLPVKLCEDARLAMKFSRASVVASGTATVEAALSGTPFVVVYRLTPLTWLLGRRLVNLDTFAMANLIAGRRIVTELIQSDFTAEKVVEELREILPEGGRRTQMLADLQEVRQRLRDSGDQEEPIVRAAREIIQNMDSPRKH